MNIIRDTETTSLPSPSTWPIKTRVNLTELAMERPEALVSTISLATSDVSTITRPDKLQELQVQLGCTFRVPLEKIRITNITELDKETGKLQTVVFDKTAAGLNSNGRVVCLPPVPTPSSAAAPRLLQTSQQNTVNIEYAIIEPTDEILSLDTTEFSQVAASTQMDRFLASVGSSYIQAPASVIAPQPSPASVNNPSTNSVNAPMAIGLGTGLAGFIVVAVAAVMITKHFVDKRRIKTLVNQQRQQHMQITKNPYEVNMQHPRGHYPPIVSYV